MQFYSHAYSFAYSYILAKLILQILIIQNIQSYFLENFVF